MDIALTHDLADRLDAVLPQTQCRRCGYDGCRPYAEAIARGDAINRCPPGGEPVIAALALLMARPIVALDPAHGRNERLRIARIDEARCIGCTLCIQACPVDAIVGAARHMHTVIGSWCTGCELCVAPCPVDCIDMPAASRAWGAEDAQAARARYDAHNRRLARAPRRSPPHVVPSPLVCAPRPAIDPEQQRRLEYVAAARVRARARRARESAKIRST